MHRVTTIDEVIQTLKSGYPVVMNVGGTGYWSYLSGHYIVLTGVSSDGTKIYVNDPGRQGNRGLVLSTQEIQNSLKPSTATYYMYYTRN